MNNDTCDTDHFIKIENKIIKIMRGAGGICRLNKIVDGTKRLGEPSDVYTAISRLVKRGIILSRKEVDEYKIRCWSHQYKGYALREYIETKQKETA